MAIILDWQAVMPLVLMLMAVGFLSGFLAGLLGIGGGAWLLAPVLQLWGIGALYGAAAAISFVGTALVQFVPRTTPDSASFITTEVMSEK